MTLTPDDDLVAKVDVRIDAVADDVWEALTDADTIRDFMFGAEVDTDWRAGSTIAWRGEVDGRKFADTGELLEVAPGALLKYTHRSGDRGPTHTVTWRLHSDGASTDLSLRQDGNADSDARRHAEANWLAMLGRLKAIVERRLAG